MLPKGTRVQLHAATDAWMSSDRYGEIVGTGRTRTYTDRSGNLSQARPYRVKLDKSGRTIRVHPENLFSL